AVGAEGGQVEYLLGQLLRRRWGGGGGLEHVLAHVQVRGQLDAFALQRGQRLRRNHRLVVHATHVEDDVVHAPSNNAPLEPGDHRPTAARRRAAAWYECAWHRAMARASAASSGRGMSGRSSRRRTICCTCCLL